MIVIMKFFSQMMVVFIVGFVLFGVDSVMVQSFICVNNFGFNFLNVKMFIYVFRNFVVKFFIIVVIYYCIGIVQVYFSGSLYRQFVDQKGFIVIYFELFYLGICWDGRFFFD